MSEQQHPEQSDSHRCPADGCTRQVPPHQLMCPRHWRLVARSLQRRLYAAWSYGEGAGSEDHTAAMDACVRDVNLKLEGSRS